MIFIPFGKSHRLRSYRNRWADFKTSYARLVSLDFRVVRRCYPVLFETYLQIVFVMRAERNEDGHLPGNPGLKIPVLAPELPVLSKGFTVLTLRDVWLQISEFLPC